MIWQVSHRTTYAYDDVVNDSLGIAYVTPRQLPWQSVHEHALTLTPAPLDGSTDLDFYGNTATYFQVTEPHDTLEILATSTVDVGVALLDPVAMDTPWELARPGHRHDLPDAWRAVDFALPSALADQTDIARAYAARSLTPGRPIGEAALDLMHRIHADFTYEQGATTVTSTIDDVFAKAAGVCQDFAHLTLACLRSHGLAVRYVSGYLATEPAPGHPRVVGADASHAWAAVWLPSSEPGGSWLALDPTNDQVTTERYVTVAWGRDYGDVPPVKGVIFTDAKKSTLTVEVDVAPAPRTVPPTPPR
ncbi:MAG: hypothetical protein JWO46_1956 [Nocardioidaceae bacterium]|nr:hypothetical protein [Nocardioidaceae bacterium]